MRDVAPFLTLSPSGRGEGEGTREQSISAYSSLTLPGKALPLPGNGRGSLRATEAGAGGRQGMWVSLRVGLANMAVPLLLAASAALAGGPGTTAMPFLKVGPGARPAAMGSAFAGLADDINALYWNPAGLANLFVPEFSVLHSQHILGTSYQSMGYAYPVPFVGTLAAAATVLDYGGVKRVNERPDGMFEETSGVFDPRDILLTVGWGTPIPGLDRVKAGVSAKSVIQQMSTRTMLGLGLSTGLLWDTPLSGLRFGMVGENLGVVAEEGGSALPIGLVTGASWQFLVGKNVRALAVADTRLAVDTTAVTGVGGEMVFLELLSGRVGWREGGTEGGLTWGAGLMHPIKLFGHEVMLKLDYNASSLGELGQAQRLEFSVRFGGVDRYQDLGSLRFSRKGDDPVLTWQGAGPAWHVFARRKDETEFRQLTDTPLLEPQFSLLGMPPGRYRFKIVNVDPNDPDYTGGESSELELNIMAEGTRQSR